MRTYHVPLRAPAAGSVEWYRDRRKCWQALATLPAVFDSTEWSTYLKVGEGRAQFEKTEHYGTSVELACLG